MLRCLQAMDAAGESKQPYLALVSDFQSMSVMMLIDVIITPMFIGQH